MAEPQEGIPRREFLGLSAAAIKTLVGLGLTLQPVSSILTDSLLPAQKFHSDVTFGKGYRAKLILGQHESPLHPSDKQDVTQIKKEDFARPIAAIFADEIGDWTRPNFIADHERSLPTWVNSYKESRSFNYEKYRLVLEQHIPLIYGDLTLTDEELETYETNAAKKDMYALVSGAVTGLGLAAAPLTRRKLLKTIIAGVIVPSALSDLYLSSDRLLSAAGKLGAPDGSKTQQDLAAILSDLIHPDNYEIVMRNIIWALKINDFYERGILPKDKIINVVGGWYHRFVGFFLQHPDIAENYFRTFGYKDYIKSLPNKQVRETAVKSLIYRYKDKSEYIEHPGLHKLMQ